MASVNQIEMFYLNSTLNYGILPVLVFQLDSRHPPPNFLLGFETGNQPPFSLKMSHNISEIRAIIFSHSNV